MSETETSDVVRSVLDQDGVEFRALAAGDLTDAIRGEMLEIYAEVFSGWPPLDPGVPLLDYLRWKTSCPSTRIAAVQARVGGTLAFTTTAMNNWLRIGGARRLRNVMLDAATRTDFQGRGLFSRSVAHRTRLLGSDLDLSLQEMGVARTRAPLERRKHHTTVANLPTHRYRVLRPRAFARDRGRPAIAPIAALLAASGALSSAARRGALRQRRHQPRDVATFDRRFDALFEEAAGEFDVLCERNEAFLNWRYGDRRAGPFIVRSIGESDRLLGYAVLRLAGARAHVADLLVAPGREDVVEVLLDDAATIARNAGAASLWCWLTNHHPYRRALRRQGFVDSRSATVLQYNPIGASPADLAALRDPHARIHFLIGDTDLV